MFDYLKKTSVIHLKEFTVDSINYIRPQKYSLHSFYEHKLVREP